MQTRRLGQNGPEVTELCLGTMTWGQQNTEAEAHDQLDYALGRGINFIDTAEMYPVPPKAETQGLTEQYIGSWIKKRGGREDFILATKVAGPNRGMEYIRQGPDFTSAHIEQAIDSSLQRLQTDYVDLYQLHWPSRHTNYFGQLGYRHVDDSGVPFEETIGTLVKLMEQGKIRHYGLSNESPWGTMKILQVCEKNGWPKPVSIQNPYNLLNRSYEVGMSEVSHREGIGLLAYSPMAFGVLSGKFLNGQKPEGARVTLFPRFTRYSQPHVDEVVAKYVQIAEQAGLTPAAMSLMFVTQQPFVTSNIIGATSIQQLEENINTAGQRLNAEVLEALDAVHLVHSNPCP
ncbi:MULTISPECIES: NADP(H)-dependent aldo-keto reductase [unclassified Thalassolituus]|uniref:NADP(H)-dependent aldo-keto reductase n=1 Tax=unclassified Thalassolituus TaxID=2624967 RepID=UPI000C37D160|nr:MULTISPECIES: NADP(H)-dependent aldo-keto reductase [unclassified Thalassolituus]MAS25982.1 NADP(H)-dependent aldo-keto reductase [Oceanospirillaceae bacterium]MBL33531.1 NADP(H)-dependent aldo-keto reductase [Oceanospirillaceae bacterium]